MGIFCILFVLISGSLFSSGIDKPLWERSLYFAAGIMNFLAAKFFWDRWN